MSLVSLLLAFTARSLTKAKGVISVSGFHLSFMGIPEIGIAPGGERNLLALQTEPPKRIAFPVFLVSFQVSPPRALKGSLLFFPHGQAAISQGFALSPARTPLCLPLPSEGAGLKGKG